MVLLGWLSDAPAAGLVCVLAFAALVRYTVSLHSYSGMATPPMFGDYEAQRHWMEITLHTPLGDWYRQTADNDLQYWGLDYPPLSAYVSWLCGKVAQVWEPASVALLSSRGYETATSKLFMRLSVLVLDAALYFPAAAILCLYGAKYTRNRGEREGSAARCHALEWLLLLLLQPGLVLIDHGHFQYNAVSLAFTLWAVLAIASGRELFGSAIFCLLCFKTMSCTTHPLLLFPARARCAPARHCCAAQLGVVVLAVLAFISALLRPCARGGLRCWSWPGVAPHVPVRPRHSRIRWRISGARCPSCRASSCTSVSKHRSSFVSAPPPRC